MIKHVDKLINPLLVVDVYVVMHHEKNCTDFLLLKNLKKKQQQLQNKPQCNTVVEMMRFSHLMQSKSSDGN